ncbi:MAG: hypothetical protein QNJ42_14010 [Crocosphaera sp.]|nr:hypothetical protein [Crocosphaera sp.]
MTHQQLTLLDAPENTPTSQHEYENENTCNHQWVPGSDQHGLFAWRCRNCWVTKKADPIADHNRIVKSAQKFKRVFEDYNLTRERENSYLLSRR